MTTAVAEPPVGATVTAAEMMLGADLSYRQLDHWTRRGLLRAIVAQPGSGEPRRWPTSELAVACAMVRLRAVGLELETAAYLARRRVDAGERRIERVARGVVLCLYPDLWEYELPAQRQESENL